MKGVYITFEGPESCGKSEQVRRIAEALKTEGYDVLTTKQPGGTEIGKKLREVLLYSGKPLPITESLLFWADRYEHYETVVKPALMKGMVVLGDRDADTSWAIQVNGRGISPEWMEGIQNLVVQNYKPDLTILYGGSISTFLQRMKNREKPLTRFDSEEKEFHERSQEGFIMRYKSDPKRIRLISAMPPADTVFKETYTI